MTSRARSTEGLGSADLFKLALMDAIHRDLQRRYPSQIQAGVALDVDHTRLNRLGRGHHEYFSIQYLFRLADAARVQIRIEVEPVVTD